MEEKETIQVTEEQSRETNRFWEDPEKFMKLIDLLFLWEDTDKKQICS